METNLNASNHRSKKIFFFFLLVSLFEGIGAFIFLANIPADAKHAVFLGLSFNRLLLLAVMGLGNLLFLFFLILQLFQPRFTEVLVSWGQTIWIRKFVIIAGVILTMLLLVPQEAWGEYHAVQERLFPFILWLCLLTIQWALVSLFLDQEKLERTKIRIKEGARASKIAFLISMGILVALYIASTFLYPGASDEDFWYETGVPLLTWQILAAVMVGFIFAKFEKGLTGWASKHVDLILFIGLFLLFGIIWALVPLTPSYFNVGPFPPDRQYYPYSDGAKYDLQGQSALVGLGFDNGTPLDRPYYPMLLAIIHLVNGQDYEVNAAVQAFLFGVFPAIIYLIGAEIGSRKWGGVTAIAVGLWGVNLIQANNVLSTATQKMFLTDFPAAIGVSLVVYFAIRWQKDGFHANRLALLTGGMIALVSYVRYSALVLLPILGGIVLFQSPRNTKKWITTNLVLLLGFLIVVAPWYIRDISAGRRLRPPFWGKIAFILRDRYSQEESNAEIDPDLPPLNAIEDPTMPSNSSENSSEDSSKMESEGNDLSKPFSNWFSCHLIHNVMSSVLILPSSLEISSLELYLDNAGDLWESYWNGRLPLGRFLVTLVQFAIFSIGVGSIVKKDRNVAAVLLLTFLGLQFTNALGRTSGGRYILPGNWLVMPIYFAGILCGIRTLFLPPDQQAVSIEERKISRRSDWVMPILVLLSIGMLPVVFEVITNQVISPPKIFDYASEDQVLDLINLSDEDKLVQKEFLVQNQAALDTGLAFYPIPQEIDLSDANYSDVQAVLGETGQILAKTFELMRLKDRISVIFPYQDPIKLVNKDQVVLIGCNANKDTVVVRELFVTRDGVILHYESDIAFENCD